MTQQTDCVPVLWRRWLGGAAIVVLVFGLALVFAASPMQAVFEAVYYSPRAATALGPDAVAYTAFMGAVLGGVMIGWATLLLFVLAGPFRRAERSAWDMIAVSLAAWFVPDTAYSAWSGFWPNVVLNAALLVVFVIPLAATYRTFHEGGGPGQATR